MRQQRFQDKAVLVTGSAGGIGEAVAHAFAAEGASLVVVDQDGANAHRVADAIMAGGCRAQAIEADLSEEEGIRGLVRQTIDGAGGIDVIFASAGVLALGDVVDFKVEDYERVFNINVRGLFLLLREALPGLRRTKGCVVATSSVAGLRGFAGNGVART